MFYVKELRRGKKNQFFLSQSLHLHWWYWHCFYQYDSIIYYIVSFNATHAKILRSIKNNKNTSAIHANGDAGNKRHEWQKLQIRRIATIYYLSYHFGVSVDTRNIREPPHRTASNQIVLGYKYPSYRILYSKIVKVENGNGTGILVVCRRKGRCGVVVANCVHMIRQFWEGGRKKTSNSFYTLCRPKL